ncbi:GL10558 [Drosophila persimilis]|uniref:GPI ethanolamine phosphate transferase 1 n=1 Tax=Drosophila persimilis TaxID=7234 RepID=B4GBA2_DROPE|nr:GL10558 [Drosophila persimilis]
MWIFYAFLVHVLLLGSILVINFRSTVIKGLQPQTPLLAYDLNPPATRLVLFATDGLRAASFFEDNCRHVPHLREIFMREGLVGISRTRAPTESRPGHIALLAGFYEDPSAVFKGWKGNPIDFDSVLNRSGYSFSWGCPNIMDVFKKVTKRGGGVHFHPFNDDVYETARWATYRLDEWVFSQVSALLDRIKNKWNTFSTVVFFLHLMSSDRAGHVHKPGTILFQKSLNITERGIWEMYRKFEETFPDKNTVYLLTSDHGMTDTGIHGSGTAHEIETPFMLWGAGVSRIASTGGARKFVANDDGLQLPLHELEQAQLTPLMSALLGLPPPMNNFGTLPTGYMAVSEEYEAMAAHSNALQLLAQYEKLLEQHREGFFADFLNNFDQLSPAEIKSYKKLILNLHTRKAYSESLARSNVVMELTLKGIDYYHGYYRNCLLLSTTATFLGIHGSGTAHEIETPFMLWGAGVSRIASTGGARKFVANDDGLQLPLHELEQAQLTPLMSALLGLPPPMNNFGTLPTGYMAVSEEYEAMAAHSNALQLLAQYEKLLEQHREGFFADFLNNFDQLSPAEIKSYKKLILNLHTRKAYSESLARSNVVMELTLKGIDYYHGYYRNCLLLSTTATFLGWIFYLYRLLSRNTAGKLQIMLEKQEKVCRITLDVSMFLLLFFLVAQRAPIAIAFYLLLPMPVWMMALKPKACGSTSASVPSSQPGVTARMTSASQLLLIIVCAELMVFTFFERRLISLCFVAFGFYNNWRNFVPNSREFYTWLALVIILACFPLLPPSVGYQNWYLVLAGIVLIVVNALWCKERRLRFTTHTKYCNALVLVNTFICVHLHSNQIGVPIALHLASWMFLIYAFASILFNSESKLEARLAQICFNLGSLYALLCTSYESVFVQLLTMELSLSLAAQSSRSSEKSVLRLAFTILLYTFFSLFGSGNIASISSFDPNIARCFLSTFLPFIIMGLVLLKLLLPVVLNLSIVYTHCECAREQEQRIFICLLIICDIMGLNFLFLVRNQGSWMDIGSSISHFVIMEVTTLVLLLLSYVAKLLLRLVNCDRLVEKLR